MKTQIIINLYDAIVREPKLIWQYYRPFFLAKGQGKMIFMADGKFRHGGMFDRLKGIISVYAAAKALDKEFRICFTSPFDLRRYLEPNLYDWTVNNDDIKRNFTSARPLFLYGEYRNPRRLLKQRTCDAHFYYGYDSLDYINKKCHRDYDWGELYRELFKPSAYLQKAIDIEKKKAGTKYVTCHFRFMNLLGDANEVMDEPTLPPEGQSMLMQSAMAMIKEAMAHNPGHKVMLACDSNMFAQFAIENMNNVYIIPGSIRHIGTSETDDSENLKMFLDYHMMANADKVYNFYTDGMWKSAFPEYAAKIGGIDFKRIKF